MNINEISMPNTVIDKIYVGNEFDTMGLITREYKDSENVLGYIESEAYLQAVKDNDRIKVLVTTEELAPIIKEDFEIDIIVSNKPKTTFFQIQEFLVRKTDFYGGIKENNISDSAIIHETAVIEDHNVVIGDGTIILANAVIKANSTIGKNVIIREGVVIGTPAFYYYDLDDHEELVVAGGGVRIDDHVEIHSNTSIEAGVFNNPTHIGRNTKIDNCCLIGHDSILGENIIMAAGCSVGGIVTAGDGTFFGLNSSVAQLMNIGSNCKISIGSSVTKDVPDGAHYSGTFAIDHKTYVNHLKNINK